MDRVFQIGEFCFHIVSELPYDAPENLLQFDTAAGIPQYTYYLQTVSSLPILEGKQIVRRPDLEVLQEDDRETRLLGIKGWSEYYACYQEKSANEAQVWVTGRVEDLMPSDTIYGSFLALERRMISLGGLILHCAFIEYQGKAILFSAPSGVGKSTQAELWQRYRGSQTINGDRALLRKKNGTWYACGWPVCGSSGICKRRELPIHAIVMLQQGKKNQVLPLSPARSFGQIYPQITINQWNGDFVRAAMNEIEDLIMQVPVWQLTCDISEDAVSCLERQLFAYHAKEMYHQMR